MSRFTLGGVSAGGKYRILDFPVLQADADGDNFVQEFTGASGASETGAGVLTGGDLVFTQHGGISGASGGYRSLSHGSLQYFSATAAWFNTFFGNASGFGMVWRLRGIPAVAGEGMAYTAVNISNNPSASPVFFALGHLAMGYLYTMSKVNNSDPGQQRNIGGASQIDTLLRPSGDLYYLVSFDFVNKVYFNGLFHNEVPSFSEDSVYMSLLAGLDWSAGAATYSVPAVVGATGSFSGNSTSRTLGCSIGSVTATKYPLVVEV